MVKESVAMVAEGRTKQEADTDTERQAQARIAQTQKTEAITEGEGGEEAAAAGEATGSAIVSSSSGGAGEVVDRGRNKRRARGSPHVAARHSKSSKKAGAGSGERREPVCEMASAGKRSSVFRGVTRWLAATKKKLQKLINTSSDRIALDVVLFRLVFLFR